MAAQKGLDMLLKIGDGEVSETFATVGGIRSVSFVLNQETVDITHQGSTGRWRELLAGAAVRSASISGSGVFIDDASAEDIRAYFFAGTIPNWEIVIPDFGTMSGAFQIDSLELGGEHDGEVTFSISLSSGGEISFTAA